jgi:hypothetical protein
MTFRYVDESFTLAGPRRKRKHKPCQGNPSPRVQLDRATDELLSGNWFTQCYRPFNPQFFDILSFFPHNAVAELLRVALDELDFAIAPVDSPVNVLCLGLGSPTSSRNSRAQLAFLLKFCDSLDIVRFAVVPSVVTYPRAELRPLNAASP